VPDVTHSGNESSPDALALPRWWEEHSELDQMVADVTQTLEASGFDAALTALSKLKQALEQHFTVEETIYFPLIERLAPEEAGSVRAAQGGHDRMRRALDDLQEFLAGGDRSGVRRVLAELLAGLSEHESHEKQLIRRLQGA
jgi:hemerythrin